MQTSPSLRPARFASIDPEIKERIEHISFNIGDTLSDLARRTGNDPELIDLMAEFALMLTFASLDGRFEKPLSEQTLTTIKAVLAGAGRLLEAVAGREYTPQQPMKYPAYLPRFMELTEVWLKEGQPATRKKRR